MMNSNHFNENSKNFNTIITETLAALVCCEVHHMGAKPPPAEVQELLGPQEYKLPYPGANRWLFSGSIVVRNH